MQSEYYDFALRDMFVPEFLTPKDIARIGRAAPSKSETRFTLPFIDAPAGDTPKNAVIAYAEIRGALKSLPDDTLLFLRMISRNAKDDREPAPGNRNAPQESGFTGTGKWTGAFQA